MMIVYLDIRSDSAIFWMKSTQLFKDKSSKSNSAVSRYTIKMTSKIVTYFQGWPSGLGNELIIRTRQVQLLYPGLLI